MQKFPLYNPGGNDLFGMALYETAKDKSIKFYTLRSPDKAGK